MKLKKYSSEEHACMMAYFKPDTFMKMFNDFLAQSGRSVLLGREFDKDALELYESYLFEVDSFVYSFINTLKGVILTICSGVRCELEEFRTEFAKFIETL